MTPAQFRFTSPSLPLQKNFNNLANVAGITVAYNYLLRWGSSSGRNGNILLQNAYTGDKADVSKLVNHFNNSGAHPELGVGPMRFDDVYHTGRANDPKNYGPFGTYVLTNKGSVTASYRLVA